MMLKRVRMGLGWKIALMLIIGALPIMLVGAYIVVQNEHAAVKEFMVSKGRIAALAGAQQIGHALERGLDSGAFATKELFNPEYEEIKFPFKVASKRYRTKFDTWTDNDGWQGFEDAFLADPDFIYASAMDMFGYVPTPHLKYAEIPNGDAKHDLFSRWKRRYNEALQLAAVRYEGTEPTFVQEYHRDTGEMVWDVAAPIYVRGQHWGAFRVGVLQRQILIRGRELGIRLFVILFSSLLLVFIVTTLLVHRAMRPLKELTALAEQLSLTDNEEVLKTVIKPQTEDEIGAVAKAMNRLRASLYAAMTRLPSTNRTTRPTNGSQVKQLADGNQDSQVHNASQVSNESVIIEDPAYVVDVWPASEPTKPYPIKGSEVK